MTDSLQSLRDVVFSLIKLTSPVSREFTESGDGLVVRYWTVDQEVVCSNPTHGRNLFLSCARIPGLLSPFGKMSAGSRGPPHGAGTKITGQCRWLAVVIRLDCTPQPKNDNRLMQTGHRIFIVYVAVWLWSVIAPTLVLKTIPDVLAVAPTGEKWKRSASPL